MTGLAAYFGVNDIAQSKAGETFVVSSAAGAVGSIAGQIAKIKGSRVIGIAGGKAKCDWVVNDAGFDAAIDYHSETVGSRLSELCPKGIDVYFDNVGGPLLDEVLMQINLHARIGGLRCDISLQHNRALRPCELREPRRPSEQDGRVPRAGLRSTLPRSDPSSVGLAARRPLEAKRGRCRGPRECSKDAYASIYRREFRKTAFEDLKIWLLQPLFRPDFLRAARDSKSSSRLDRTCSRTSSFPISMTYPSFIKKTPDFLSACFRPFFQWIRIMSPNYLEITVIFQ
jgi:hypothetical protein